MRGYSHQDWSGNNWGGPLDHTNMATAIWVPFTTTGDQGGDWPLPSSRLSHIKAIELRLASHADFRVRPNRSRGIDK